MHGQDNGRLPQPKPQHPSWCARGRRCQAAVGGLHRSVAQEVAALDGVTSATVWLEGSDYGPPRVAKTECGPAGVLSSTWDLERGNVLGMVVAALASEAGFAPRVVQPPHLGPGV